MLARTRNGVRQSAALALVMALALWSCKQHTPTHTLRPARGAIHYGGTYRINMLLSLIHI